MLDCFSVTVFVLNFRGLPFEFFSAYLSTQFQTAVPFLKHSVDLLDTGNLSSRSEGVIRMISLGLGSVRVEGKGGVNLRFKKKLRHRVCLMRWCVIVQES